MMKRMQWGITGWTVVLAAAMAVPTMGLGAQEPDQERRQETSCRCVDRDGNEIENCRCLRVFSGEPIVASVGSIFPRRAMIGVTINAAQDTDADRQGARIERVQEGSPAEQAGFEVGDLVVSVGGQSVFDALPDRESEASLDLDQSVPVQRFQRLVGDLEPGEPVDFEVVRDGSRRTLTVTPERASGFRMFGSGSPQAWQGFWNDSLTVDVEALREGSETMRRRLEELGARERWMHERPGVFRFELPRLDSIEGTQGLRGSLFRIDPCGSGRVGPEDAARSVWVFGRGNCVDGVEFVDVNPELGEYFGTDHGALAAEVADESQLGLRPGDVVIAIDGREVTDAQQVQRILASYRADEEMRLRIRRQGEEIEVLGRRR